MPHWYSRECLNSICRNISLEFEGIYPWPLEECVIGLWRIASLAFGGFRHCLRATCFPAWLLCIGWSLGLRFYLPYQARYFKIAIRNGNEQGVVSKDACGPQRQEYHANANKN